MIGNKNSRASKLLTALMAGGALVGAYCVATAGISTLLMAATDGSAQAAPHGHGGNWHGGNWHGGGWHGGGWHGGWHGGRYWHGRWWGPGVGPCWRWTPVGWIWVC
jgi:hypothetical protein